MTESDTTPAPTEPTQGISTPVLAAIIGVGAVLAAVAAFFVTSTLLSGGQSLAERCAAAKAGIIEIRTANPSTDTLGPAEDAALQTLANELRSSCTYVDVIDFDTTEVFPWLGISPEAPAPSTGGAVPSTGGAAPAGATTVPVDPTAPLPTTPAPTEPSTTSTEPSNG